MNKMLLIGLIGIGPLISGCTTQPSNDKNDLFKYDNKNHVVGDKNNYVKKVIYTEGDDKRIVFYIDRFPYKKEFSLCNKNEFIQNVESTYKDSKYLENKKITCKSFISIDKTDLKVPYWTSFNFNFLDNAKYDKQNNVFVESGNSFNIINSFFQDGKNEVDNFKKINFLFEQ